MKSIVLVKPCTYNSFLRSLSRSVSLRSRLSLIQIMELDNRTVQEDLANGFAMEALIKDYHAALFFVCLGSLILGVPLAWNILWHLKERNSMKDILFPQTHALP